MTDNTIQARLTLRLKELTQACLVNEVAAAAYERAAHDAHTHPGEHTAHALTTTARAWDSTRDDVVKAAQIFLHTANIALLSPSTPGTLPLRRMANNLQDAFRTEETTFLLYSNISGGSAEAREKWQAARSHIVHLARGIAAQSLTDESTVTTNLDGSTPAHHS